MLSTEKAILLFTALAFGHMRDSDTGNFWYCYFGQAIKRTCSFIGIDVKNSIHGLQTVPLWCSLHWKTTRHIIDKSSPNPPQWLFKGDKHKVTQVREISLLQNLCKQSLAYLQFQNSRTNWKQFTFSNVSWCYLNTRSFFLWTNGPSKSMRQLSLFKIKFTDDWRYKISNFAKSEKRADRIGIGLENLVSSFVSGISNSLF